MSNDSPERQKEIAQAIEYVAEQLVVLGYVKRSIANSSTGQIHLNWTEQGIILKREMHRILPLILSSSEPERFDMDKLCAFMSYLTTPPPGNVRDR